MSRLLLHLLIATAACGDDGARHITDAPAGASSPGIYVTSPNNSITVFASDATGDAAPIRTISGASTMLSLPIGIVVDAVDNIYVANRTGSAVTVYPSSATGDTAPVRVLTGTNMLSPESLALGTANELFAATCPGCGSSAGGATGVFHFMAGGTTSDYDLQGTNTGFTVPGVLVDATGQLVVANSFGGPIETFAKGAMGDIAPIRTFNPTSGNTQSTALGKTTIARTFGSSSTVELYDPTATGTATPIGSFVAPALNYPGGIFWDTANNVMYLADFGGNAIYVLTLAGTEPNLTIASTRIIMGPSTTLNQPLGIAIIP